MQRKRIAAPLVLGLLVGSCAVAYGQAQEVEPNNTCATAQDLSSATFTSPYVVNGSIDAVGDVDFYMFAGTPGTVIRVDLEGVQTGKGSLENPELGLFSYSNCNNGFVWDGGSGIGENARLIFRIPSDGHFVIAATDPYDSGFTGAGYLTGSYQMTVTTTSAIGSIGGRILDAGTGAPISGVDTYFAHAYLERCEDAECSEYDWVNDFDVDAQGRFQFRRQPGAALRGGMVSPHGVGKRLFPEPVGSLLRRG